MAKPLLGSISKHFSQREYRRIERNKLHPRLTIIAIAICGAIHGAENWVDIALYRNRYLPKNATLHSSVFQLEEVLG